ncbi:amidase [Cryptococcus neoformans var. grubii Br795]|nr:amidase [Cryptococcus neoformans var. grubii 125.91]OWZ67788.1 hypothetical protein AYX15_01300 [Cryptococcus neoformans var. grubii]OXG82046.1 amidase [Cryptococcus neoformans var. grubii MW-RSA36]OXG83250.1 amidase [Cryptococcus neoformans var. grubii Br795]OXG88177.1 amidase [Cryptococcus neoformans var. grubii D17-1]OXG96802.1 amidase [Cryptococcus neoformans var. grubii A2-102-5]OXL08567.1 amidase [Cryptococcus neoformans var. grubii Gb118]
MPVPAKIQPAVDADRLNKTLQFSCQWGSTPDGGMDRLALNDDDATVRRWFISEAKKLGCSVKVDAIGNIFAVRPGRSDLPPIAIGSHLDTQPTGGRYDGILGVLAGLEILKAVHEVGYETEYPLAVVVWTNEEGARFIPSCLGSSIWAQDRTLEFGYSRIDTNGTTLLQELERHQFLGSTPANPQANPLSAHFELHIEQGPILFEANHPVATVKGVQGWRWFEIKLQGRGSHAGTTPMTHRHDPLGAFARMVVAAEELAVQHGGLATIGRMSSIAPQSTNCVMDDVVFHLDVRHHELAKLDRLEKAMRETFDGIVKSCQGVSMHSWATLDITHPTTFDALAVNCIREATKSYPEEVLISGAGHDSVYTAMQVPTAMVFIRCRDGISHHPSEYSTPEDIAIGAQILLEAVLSYEKQRR